MEKIDSDKEGWMLLWKCRSCRKKFTFNWLIYPGEDSTYETATRIFADRIDNYGYPSADTVNLCFCNDDQICIADLIGIKRNK